MESGEGLFKELVENSEDIHVVTDGEYRIRYISSSIARFTGIEPVSLLGQSILNFVDPANLARWKERLAMGEDFRDEITLFGKGQRKLYFNVSARVSRNGMKVKGIALKLHDITLEKLREEELIRSNRQLDQVIYKTTHDLKAPIMSALGLIKLAEKVSDEEKDQYISMIKKSLLKLESFVDEMNNFYRTEKMAVKREQVDVAALLVEEWEDLKNASENNHIDLQFDLETSVPLFSDLVRVKTIFTNILSNAIKYMDLQKQNPFVKIAARVTVNYLDIAFEDNGIGIDPEHQEKIFDLFFRATDHAQGTGLGLFIVKDTLERLKGTVDVTSTVGIGTIFRIRIPNQLHQPSMVE